MIKTTDLMLGNWVEVKGKKNEEHFIPMKIVGIYEREVSLDFGDNKGDVCEIPDEDLLGIEITEDLLAKIGFHVDMDVDDNHINKEIVFGEFGEFSVRRNKVDFDVYNFHEDVPLCVTYLHELQNAYHLLIGKELEVKL